MMSIQTLHLTQPAMSVSGTSQLTHAGRAGELGRSAAQKGAFIVIWKALITIAILSAWLGTAAAQEEGKPPAPIPEKEWAAWVTAEATLGVMHEFVPGLVRFKVTDRAGPGDLPAFRFDDWPPKQKLADLPAITVPFGLD